MRINALIVTVAALLAPACNTPITTVASSPAVTAATTLSPAVTTTQAMASPTGRAGFTIHQNPILGYRISLPDAYRRLTSVVLTGGGENLGNETYTRRTEIEERELCLRPQGDGPPAREREADVVVLIYRNIDNVSATQWANTPRVPDSQAFSKDRTVQPVSVDGRDAIRLVWQRTNETAAYVIPANDRLFVIAPPVWSFPSSLPQGWLDDIAMSFQAITPQPSPAPIPTPSPTPRCGG